MADIQGSFITFYDEYIRNYKLTGGATHMASKLKISRQALRKWRLNGVPPLRVHEVIAYIKDYTMGEIVLTVGDIRPDKVAILLGE